jgi:hypothetical protein
MVSGVQLKTEYDKNHQNYVANYVLYEAALFFATNSLSFWVNQARRDIDTGRQLLVMFFIYISMLYMTTYFFI